jgi:hypothetical protein
MRRVVFSVVFALVTSSASSAEDETLAAAAKLARAAGLTENPALAASMKASIVVTNPEKIPPQAEPVVEKWLNELLGSPEWIEATAKLIATHLKPDEMSVLQAQFESPEWRHYQEVLPKLNEGISAQMNKALRDRGPELRKRIKEVQESR